MKRKDGCLGGRGQTAAVCAGKIRGECVRVWERGHKTPAEVEESSTYHAFTVRTVLPGVQIFDKGGCSLWKNFSLITEDTTFQL